MSAASALARSFAASSCNASSCCLPSAKPRSKASCLIDSMSSGSKLFKALAPSGRAPDIFVCASPSALAKSDLELPEPWVEVAGSSLAFQMANLASEGRE